MADRKTIEQVVERAVSQVLETQLPALRGELTRQVWKELEPELAHAGGAVTAGDSESSAHLLKAISTIHAGSTQREILRALLDSTLRYAGRAALFVIKAGAATGWQARGFADNDSVKDFALDVTSGVASRAVQSRMVFQGQAQEMDSSFVSKFGHPASEHVLLLPLVLKDKVAALVYADAGTASGPPMDEAALELLVAATSAWLEVASLRKQALKEGATEGTAAETPAAVQTVAAHTDPFASHAPRHVAAPSIPPAEAVAAATASVEAEPVSTMAAAAAAPARDEFSEMSPEDADVHRKAQRFARLLVDEIKLYNQAKVAEGRKHKDVYDRLKEDIEKSRATYQKRYGSTVAGSAEYFNRELVRSLAEDDSSLMGAHFRR